MSLVASWLCRVDFCYICTTSFVLKVSLVPYIILWSASCCRFTEYARRSWLLDLVAYFLATSHERGLCVEIYGQAFLCLPRWSSSVHRGIFCIIWAMKAFDRWQGSFTGWSVWRCQLWLLFTFKEVSNLVRSSNRYLLMVRNLWQIQKIWVKGSQGT